MKNFFSIVGLAACLGMAVPAAAEIRLEPIVFHQAAPLPEATNVRVNLMNQGSWTEAPERVTLEVRESLDSEWRTVKVWDHGLKIAPGQRLSLDYLPAQGELMDPALTSPSFELRAVVHGAQGPSAQAEQFVRVGNLDE